MSKPARERFWRVALVLPTEFAYARGVLRGVIAATRERNLYAAESSAAARAAGRPWLFRVYRGIYGHSSKYLARWFREFQPDGIICQIYDDRLARVYRDSGKPVVELFESRPSSEFPRILPDDVAAGRLAARHFIERGFRHFAFFGAAWMLWSGQRGQGFQREVEEVLGRRGTPFTFARYTSRTRSSAAFDASLPRRSAPIANWLASLPKPLALFAANDLWGFELMQAAREVGLRIPDDVAVLGVDNEELLCEIAHPPLSSIRIASDLIGREAVRALEALLRGSRLSGDIARFPPAELVTRQSTDVLAVEDPDVAAALQHIRRHAPDGLSVKQMLASLPINRRTLERRFVSILGHTPLEEIRRVRMERARTLLQTDMPIYDVAQRSGFGSPEYLATSFVHSTGMTPTQYRRQFALSSRLQRLPPIG